MSETCYVALQNSKSKIPLSLQGLCGCARKYTKYSITYGICCEDQALGILKALQHQTNFGDVTVCRIVAYLYQTKKVPSHNKIVIMSAFVI